MNFKSLLSTSLMTAALTSFSFAAEAPKMIESQAPAATDKKPESSLSSITESSIKTSERHRLTLRHKAPEGPHKINAIEAHLEKMALEDKKQILSVTLDIEGLNGEMVNLDDLIQKLYASSKGKGINNPVIASSKGDQSRFHNNQDIKIKFDFSKETFDKESLKQMLLPLGLGTESLETLVSYIEKNL